MKSALEAQQMVGFLDLYFVYNGGGVLLLLDFTTIIEIWKTINILYILSNSYVFFIFIFQKKWKGVQ